MKKIDILNIINANRILNQNNKTLSITRDKRFPNIKIDEEFWFPEIEELKKEFNILKKEIKDAQEESKKCQMIINKSKCNHEVRLKHFGIFGSHSNCIFCNKTIMADNCVNWEYSVNRNKHCVDFISKYQDDEDYDYIEEGYTKEEIYLLIEKILESKQDDEEIDLVQELKQLNLDKCTIIDEPFQMENYILILSGNNRCYVDEETYLYNKRKTNIALELLNYFSELVNTKIELIDSENHEINDINSKIKIQEYETIDELNQILKRQQEIPFKIIIDITELYDYSIQNNGINKKEITLNLEDLFPNSKIIKIKLLSNKKKKKY